MSVRILTELNVMRYYIAFRSIFLYSISYLHCTIIHSCSELGCAINAGIVSSLNAGLLKELSARIGSALKWSIRCK